MTKLHTITRGALGALLVTLVATSAQAQSDQGGVFTAGDLWETFLPTNVAKSYRESGGSAPADYYMLIRVGNLDRQWTTPSMTYPGGENIIAFNGGGTSEDQILWETEEDPTGVLNRAFNGNGQAIYGPARRVNLGFTVDF